jgi:hypothetical protein
MLTTSFGVAGWTGRALLSLKNVRGRCGRCRVNDLSVAAVLADVLRLLACAAEVLRQSAQRNANKCGELVHAVWYKLYNVVSFNFNFKISGVCQ